MEFMKSASQAGLKSVSSNAALLKKTYIPKYVFTLAKVTSTFINTVFSFGAFIIVMIATRSPFHWQLIFVPLILIQLYVFTLGISFLLAEMNVFFRDIEYIYNAVCVAWTYLTPIFYPIERLPNLVQVVVKTLNPMYYYVTQFRQCALYGQIPGAVPRVKRIIIEDLTEGAHGNAIGFGAADFILRKAFDKIDLAATYTNGMASGNPEGAKIPVICESEEEAVRAAIQTCAGTDINNVKIVKIIDTLHLSEIEVSERSTSCIC